MQQSPDDARLVRSERPTAAQGKCVAVLLTVFGLEAWVEFRALVCLLEGDLLRIEVVSMGHSEQGCHGKSCSVLH